MKTQMSIASLPLLTILCLILAAIPATAGTVYTNGPIEGNIGAFQINSGHAVSDSFTVGSGPNGTGYIVQDLHVGVWLLPGDHLVSSDVVFGTTPFGGEINDFVDLGPSGSTPLGLNAYGYEVWKIDFTTFGDIPLAPGTYWVGLQSASVGLGNGDPVYWDETLNGPSMAFQCHVESCASSQVPIPSEAFTITGTPNTPEPSSILLFGSGILGLAGVLRRRLMG